MKPLALIVEDNEDLSLIFSKAVETAGFEIEAFENGSVALERLAVVVPSLVVLDLHLPGASGETILQYIRAQPQLANINVIIATADAGWGDKLNDAATLTLLKPISFSQLREMAGRLLPTQ